MDALSFGREGRGGRLAPPRNARLEPGGHAPLCVAAGAECGAETRVRPYKQECGSSTELVGGCDQRVPLTPRAPAEVRAERWSQSNQRPPPPPAKSFLE